jgi:tetratricopeptide (TPR) repeat protein
VREAPATIEALTTSFIEAEGVRRAFRALYAAQRLVQAGQSLQLALKLSDQVLDQAEAATEADGSLYEFPNYDRTARLRIIRGRALDTKGQILAQLKRNKEAMTAFAEAIDSFGGFPEAKASIWRLGAVRELVGEEEEALSLYWRLTSPLRRQAVLTSGAL